MKHAKLFFGGTILAVVLAGLVSCQNQPAGSSGTNSGSGSSVVIQNNDWDTNYPGLEPDDSLID